MAWVRLGQDELILVEVGWYKWLIWASSSLLHGLSASNKLSQASADGGGGRGPKKISKSKQSLVRPRLHRSRQTPHHGAPSPTSPPTWKLSAMLASRFFLSLGLSYLGFPLPSIFGLYPLTPLCLRFRWYLGEALPTPSPCSAFYLSLPPLALSSLQRPSPELSDYLPRFWDLVCFPFPLGSCALVGLLSVVLSRVPGT